MHVAVSAAVTLSGFTSLGWWRQVHHYVPIGLVGALSWTVWLTRFTLSRVYRPVRPGWGRVWRRTTISCRSASSSMSLSAAVLRGQPDQPVADPGEDQAGQAGRHK